MVGPGGSEGGVSDDCPAWHFIPTITSNVEQGLSRLGGFGQAISNVLIPVTETNLLDDVVVKDILPDIDDVPQHPVVSAGLEVMDVGPQIVRVCDSNAL